jgi:predicted HD phosphohydrolase
MGWRPQALGGSEMTDTATTAPVSADGTSGEQPAPRAKFHAMTEGTKADWDIIGVNSIELVVGLPERLLAHLRLLDGDFGGFAVDRLTHSLQTATRAEKAGRDDEYVFCALIHDIGDTLGPTNHADIAAAIVKPWVSEQNHWMVEQHAVFQGYYFFHHLGLDRDMRDQFAGHPWYDYTAEFCAEYDQPAFDPAYPTNPLEHYEPLIRQQLQQVKRSIYQRAS